MATREGPSRRVELVPLAELKRANRNPKQHDVAYLANAIGEKDTGLVDLPIVDERTGRLIAGHGRLKALEALRERDPKARVPGVSFGPNGDWLVEVMRGWSSRDDAHAEAVLVALNRAPARGGWDMPELAKLLGELPPMDLDLSGFSLDDLEDMTPTHAAGIADESTVPSGSEVKVRQGDVWGLGDHVIACGQSPSVLKGLIGPRKPAAVVTDPPYGINIVRRKKVGGDKAFGVGGGQIIKANPYPKIAGDDRPFDPAPYLAIAKRVVLFGANHYADKLPTSTCWLVWDKRDGMESNDFADAELAWTNLKQPVRVFRHRWSGLIKASERGERRQHPTQKPVALFEWVLELATKRGDLVVEPFCGAGATLLACETKRRVCIAAELEPPYVQVTINRWEALTGKRATMLSRVTTRKGRK